MPLRFVAALALVLAACGARSQLAGENRADSSTLADGTVVFACAPPWQATADGRCTCGGHECAADENFCCEQIVACCIGGDFCSARDVSAGSFDGVVCGAP